MRSRKLISASVLAFVLALAALAPMAAQAPRQAPAPAPAAAAATASNYTIPKTTYVAPKTPWGDPDIQGVYDYQSMRASLDGRHRRPAPAACQPSDR